MGGNLTRPRRGRNSEHGCVQARTGIPTPRSSRIDSRTHNAVEAVKTSAAARTPVYFCITGAAAASATASRYPFIAAQLLFPYFTKNGVGSTAARAGRAPAER